MLGRLCPNLPPAPCLEYVGRKTCICNKDCKLRCREALNNYKMRGVSWVYNEGARWGLWQIMQAYKCQPFVAMKTWGPHCKIF